MLEVAFTVPLLASPFVAVRDANAQETSFAEAREQALALLVEDLEGLSTWCAKNRLFASRNQVYEEILRFDPDNGTAHKGLGHRRDKEGRWFAVESKQAKDFDKKAALELPLQREQATRRFIECVLSMLAERTLGFGERELLLEDVLTVDPDNAVVRGLRRDVKVEGLWVCTETALAKKRRVELRELVRNLYENSPEPLPTKPSGKDTKIGVNWTHAVENDTVRVLGTGAEDEVLLAARALYVAERYFDRVFNVEAALGDGVTVYLLADQAREKSVFLDGHPAIRPQDRPYLEQLDGSGFHECPDFAQWGLKQEWRVDSTVRFAIGWLAREAFGIYTGHGWAHEGLGLYMTRELIGTRLSWFVQPSKLLDAQTDVSLRQRLLMEETNWMNTTYEMLRGHVRPKLAEVFAKSANDLTTEDLLLGYVTVAYLLEGVPPEASGRFLSQVGKNRPLEAASKEHLGMDLEELDARIFRWLGERR